MNRLVLVVASAAFALAGSQAARAQGADPNMSFFITSTGSGKGADLGGLAGADRLCQQLATAVGAGGKTWRAYLSTQAAGGQPAVNARDRIGSGPWHNAKGEMIAKDLADLHDGSKNMISKGAGLTEKGEPVKGRGMTPNEHDILTGSQLDGTAYPAGKDMTCGNWTSSDAGQTRVGHHDRGGLDGPGRHPASWNSAHDTRGCSPAGLKSTGGNGYFYCFAAQ